MTRSPFDTSEAVSLARQQVSSRAYIVWWPVVQILRECDPQIAGIFNRQQSKTFPDGSVSLETAEDILDFWAILHPYCQSGLQLRENTLFRSLSFFPYRSYQLLTTWQYFDQIGGEEDFLVLPTDFMPEVDPNELQPQRLHCQIKLWTQSPKALPLLDNLLLDWHQSVSRGGLFGEGPANYIQGSIRKDGKQYYSFEVDVSRSGQNTINWLILSALNFGSRVFPMSEVLFAKIRKFKGVGKSL